MRCPAAFVGESRKTKTLGGVRLRYIPAKRGPGAWTCVRIDYLQPTASGQASNNADLRQASVSERQLVSSSVPTDANPYLLPGSRKLHPSVLFLLTLLCTFL